jgi:hypothetical protein
LLLR